jgi:LysM repeat protein
MDYRAHHGDTMAGIAARFHVSLSALEAANPQILDPDRIYVDELVHIPASSLPTDHPVPVPPCVVTYVVRSGDTLSSIAAAHGLSLAALEAANPQVTDPSLIYAGEVLNIHDGLVSKAPAPASPGGLAKPIPIGAVTFCCYNGGGDVLSWVSQACHIMHAPAVNWIRGYAVLCARESSGNANAVNTSDANAHGPIQSDGHPLHCSRGVAQCIPDTFAGYHMAGTSMDIYDPVANIAASMCYVMNNYGVSSDGSNLAERVQQADPNRPPKGY